MSDFDKWFEAQGYIEDDGCYQEKYLAARDAWLAQEERLVGVIERLDNIYYAPPTAIPPTSGYDFRKVCFDLKNYIDYLKGSNMKNSDIKVGKVYCATRPAENWGIIGGGEVSFEEKIIRVEVLPKPDNCYDDEGVVDLPEHLNSPEWFWIKNIETGREHWINTVVYTFKELYYEIGK